MIAMTEKQIIDELYGRLVASYQQVEPDQVHRIIEEEYARFEGKPVRDYVPLFVERHAKQVLSSLGAADLPRQETVAPAL
ncbi:hypothetical protein [Mycobacterium sp. OTB74]|jgi:hypothetical protein|uniref:three-helix bundle dimerization domain-containing protein n=1 Tax=Mycobacterium sp. OTB74 TaxID=1853452 RepID=UPI002473F878|nr:hypothetical protein [Mycobacterium sp. OTB74]MDH6244369.1 hypothetical protein [Mycobacterium sp. OTB74]